MREKLWTKFFIVICLVSLFSGMAMNMMNSSISLYMYHLYGSTEKSGLLYTMFAVVAIIIRLFVGEYTDQHGRRMIQIVGLICFVLATLGFSVFKIYFLFVIFRGLQAFGYAMFNNCINASGADLSPESRLNQGVSFVSMGSQLASAFAAIMILFVLGDADHFQRLYISIAAFSFLALVLTFFCNYEKDPVYIRNREKALQKKKLTIANTEGYKGIFKYIEKSAIPVACFYLLVCTAFCLITSFLLLYAKNNSFNNAGWFFTISAVITIASRFFSGNIADKKGPLPIMLFSIFSGILCFVLLLTGKDGMIYYIAGIGFGFLNGICSPVCFATCVKCAPLSRTGCATTTYYLAADVAYGAGNFFWSLIIDSLGFKNAFLISMWMLIAAVPFAFFVFRRRRLEKYGMVF